MFEDLLPVVIINVPYVSRSPSWAMKDGHDLRIMMSIAWPQGLLLGNWLVYCIDNWWEFSSVTIGHKKIIIDDLEYSPIFIGQSIAVDSCHSADRCLLGLLDMLDFIRMLAPALWQVGSRGVVAIPLRSLNMKHSPRIPHIRKSPTRLVNPGFGGCV